MPYKDLDKEKEMTEWLRLLLDYAEGRKEWDTGGIWVCEKHPLLPYEQGLTFDCECGGPGMRPFMPSEGLNGTQ